MFAALLDDLGQNATLAAKARCAGLLGAMVSDLRQLRYRPADKRYRECLDSVLGIFDTAKAKSVDFRVRLEAAEALGQAGDPRLAEDSWVSFELFEMAKYPVTVAEYKVFVELEGYASERWWKEGGFQRRKEPGDWAGERYPKSPSSEHKLVRSGGVLRVEGSAITQRGGVETGGWRGEARISMGR